MKKTLLAAALGLSFAMPQAEAALFNFSYTSSAGTIAGIVDGTLQGDGNTVIVNSVQDYATFDGVAGPSLPYIWAYGTFVGIPSALPMLSLDGSLMDFGACSADPLAGGCSASGADSGFAWIYGSAAAAAIGSWFGSANAFGDVSSEPYVAANWSMSPANTGVPELDATGAPVALVWLAGMLALARRKAA